MNPHVVPVTGVTARPTPRVNTRPNPVTLENGLVHLPGCKLPLSHIEGLRIEADNKPGMIGNLAVFCVFGGLGTLVLACIVSGLLDRHFIILALTLCIVALVSLQDVAANRGTGFYRLFVRLRGENDELLAFAGPDRNQILSVTSAIEDAMAVCAKAPVTTSERAARIRA